MGIETIGDDKALTWEEFEEVVKEDISKVKKRREKAENKAVHGAWIYRGQSSASWSLDTSLERFLRDELSLINDEYSARKYYNCLARIVPAINSLAGQNFERINGVEISSLTRTGPVPYYELLCYARHHGFPTPILDWTASYYVAAFFAFRHARPDENVAIYAYKNWVGRPRGGRVDVPIIIQHGPYVETHVRHYKQRSIYTICCAEIDDNIYFSNHEAAVKKDSKNHWMKKFTLRADEKEKVLEVLFSMNINEYTLFGDDEALMRMLAYKEFRDL